LKRFYVVKYTGDEQLRFHAIGRRGREAIHLCLHRKNETYSIDVTMQGRKKGGFIYLFAEEESVLKHPLFE